MEFYSDNAGKLVPGLVVGFHILVVDPDTSALMQLGSLLEQHSYKVTTTELASIAICMIQRQDNRFKLIMASINMSEQEKVQFLDFLNSKNIPLILMYPENSWEYELAIMVKGVFKLKKPITFRDVKYVWQLGLMAKTTRRENVDPTELETGTLARQINYFADNSYTLSVNSSKGKQVIDVEEDYDHVFGASGSSSQEGMLWADKGKIDLANAKRMNQDGENRKEKKMKLNSNYKGKGIVIEERTPAPEPEEEDDEDEDSYDVDDVTAEKKPRLVWTKELHERFVDAFNTLGERKARPKTIMDQMNVPDISQRQIASHLQKYKNQLKKLQESSDSNSPLDEPSIFSPITGFSPYLLGCGSSVLPFKLNPNMMNNMTYGAGTSILNPNLPQPTVPFSTAVSELHYGQNQQFLNMYRNLNPTQGFNYPVDLQNQNQQFPSMYQNLNPTQGFGYPVNTQNQNQGYNQMPQTNMNQYPGGVMNQNYQFQMPQMNRYPGSAATGGLMNQNQQFQMPQMNHYPGSGVTGGLMNQNQQFQFQMPQMNHCSGSAATGSLMNQNQQLQMNYYPGSAVTTSQMNQYQPFQMPHMNNYPGSAASNLMNQNQQFLVPQMNHYPGSAATTGPMIQNQQLQSPHMNHYPGSAAIPNPMNQPQMNHYPGSAATSDLMNQNHELQMPQMNHYLSSATIGSLMNHNQEFQMPQMNNYLGSAATGGEMNQNQDFMAPAEPMQGMNFLPTHCTPGSEPNTGYSITDILNDLPEVQEAAPTTLASPEILPYTPEVQDSAPTPPSFTGEYDGDQTLFDLDELLNAPAVDEIAEPQPVDANAQIYESLRTFLEVDGEN